MKKRVANSGFRPKVIIVGPTPPPVHGVSQAIQSILESSVIPPEMLLHLDTSDRRSLANLGHFDWRNLVIGLKNVAQLIRLSAREKPDLIYYRLSQNTPALLRDLALDTVARLFRVGVVVELAGCGYFRIAAERGLAGRLISRALERAALVLVQGESLVQPVLDMIQHTRVETSPNGLPPPELATYKCSDSNECRFLYLGILSEAKGVIVTLEALAEIQGRGREFHATFAGDWLDSGERDRILAKAEELALLERIEFPGVVKGEKKDSLFHSTDALVLPSFAEGQPNSVLEAMAYRLPVIATLVGAIPDTVVDGQTGILVQPGDVKALAIAMERLLGDSRLRVRMGVLGEMRFKQCFTLTRSHEILRDHFLNAALRRSEKRHFR